MPHNLQCKTQWISAAKKLLLPHLNIIESGDPLDLPISLQRPFAQWFEAFVRPMSLGTALINSQSEMPTFSLGNDKKISLADWYCQKLTEGINPCSPNHWIPSQKPMDQTIVETAMLAFCLAQAQSKLWDPLDKKTQNGLEEWMNRTSSSLTRSINNWNIFPILTQLALKKLGRPWKKDFVEILLAETENFFHGNGWYADGYYRQFDYYVPEEIYQLLLAARWLDDDSFTEKIHTRAARFAEDFQLFFDSEGRNICFGRSRSYKNSASFFFAMAAFCEVPGIDPGLCRSIVSKNINWFLNQPVFTPDGRMTGGFGYINEKLNEVYLGPGSYAWGYQSFLPLQLPDDHPFWTSPEPEPVRNVQRHLPDPGFTLTVNSTGNNATLYNGGSHHPFDAGEYAAKYGKFSYSSHFGFNLSERGKSFDNMICLQPIQSKTFWSHRIRFELCKSQGPWLITRHQPIDWDSNTIITTALTINGPWHVRVHLLELAGNYRICEGGTPVTSKENAETFEPSQTRSSDMIILEGGNGISAGFSLDGNMTPDVYSAANVNVLYRRSFVPLFTTELPSGVHLLATAWYADSHPQENICPPKMEKRSKNKLAIIWSNQRKDIVELNESRQTPLNILAGSGKELPTQSN